MTSSAHTLLGFDFGTKRIGIAVGQTITQQATPLASVTVKNNVPNWAQILELIHEWQPNALVVGIPLNMDGSQQDMSQRAQHFAKTLQNKTQLRVHEADERLTTTTAKQTIFEQHGAKGLEKADIDSQAAQTILTSFMQTYQPDS
jgi:putative holliday junction resolvase